MKGSAENGLKEGSVMIRTGTLTPESVSLHLKPFWKEWRVIGNSDSHVLDQDLRRAGWSFFFHPGIACRYMIGGGAGSVRLAMRRVLAQARRSGFNCLQVSEVSVGRFLGIPFVKVAAYSRHLQKSSTLKPLRPRNRNIANPAWSEG